MTAATRATLRKSSYVLSTVLVSLIGTACASHTKLSEEARVSIESKYQGRHVELRQSCYYGDLYDENERWLLSPHPFDEVSHIVDLDGAAIHPAGQRGIVPAGTPMIIDRVEFPDAHAMPKRMLTTPRYNPWVYLRLRGHVDGLPGERTYILLLPMGFSTEEALTAELERFFGAEDEIGKWLESRRPTVRAAILHKEVIEGMSTDELVAALGTPRKWVSDQTAEAPARVGWYPSKEVWIVADRVASIKKPRELRNPPGLYDASLSSKAPGVDQSVDTP